MAADTVPTERNEPNRAARSARKAPRESGRLVAGRSRRNIMKRLSDAPADRLPGLPARFRRNVFSNYATTASTVIVNIVAIPLLARGLGDTRFGIWVLVGSVLLYLELLEFGFGTATVKCVAESYAKGDTERVRRTLATSFWVLSVPGLTALAIGAVAAGVFPTVFDIPPEAVGETRVLLLLLAFNTAVSIPSDTFGGAMIALQRYDLLNATLVVVSLIQLVAWAIVLHFGGSLVALAVPTLAVGLGGQLARYLIVRQLLSGASLSPKYFDRTLVRSFSSLSVWFSLREIAQVVTHRLDTVVVGALIGVPAAAIYAVGQKLAFLVDRLIQPATSTFFPHAATLAEKGDDDGLRASVTTSTRITFAITAPLCLILVLLAKPLLRSWVGEDYVEAAAVVRYLAAAILVKAFTRPGLMTLWGTGRVRTSALLLVGEGVLNLGISVILVRGVGIEGVAIGTLTAALVIELGILLPYVCRALRLPLWPYLAAIARAHLPATTASAMLGWVIVSRGISGPIESGLAAALIGITYLGVFAATGLTREERSRLLGFVRRSHPAGGQP